MLDRDVDEQGGMINNVNRDDRKHRPINNDAVSEQLRNAYIHIYRVKPGCCYHLFSKARELVLEQYPLPEILRTRLETVILQIKILQLGKAKTFLASVMDPPNLKGIDLALELLRTLNALDADENLTPLGYHLAKLPLDPRTGELASH